MWCLVCQNKELPPMMCSLHQAAPELLAALEGCLGYFAWMMEQQTDHLTSGAAYAPAAAWLQPIRTAIAKSQEVSP